MTVTEKPRVGLMVGSPGDLPRVREALTLLRSLGIPCEVVVASAHRTPEKVRRYATSAAGRGLEVIIAAAGLAAHLPGAVAAQTTLPVIGLPLAAGTLGGLDALLAIVQMPPGIPVATVGIDAARNAALLAAAILAVRDEALAAKLQAYRKKMAAEQEAKAAQQLEALRGEE